MENETQNLELAKALRVKGDADFYFFLSEICEFGYNPDPNGPRVTEDQMELCAWLQAIYEGKTTTTDWLHMILAPRDTLKSTVLQIFALWIAVKNPNVRMLFYGEVHEQAQKRLAVVKKVITSCRTFRFAYGNLDGSTAGLPWNEDLIVISTRKNTAIREATIETAGLDVVINSRHFDWIFPDDLHSEKNTQSRDQIEQVQQKVQLLMPLLANNGSMIFAGVFWSDSDYHTRLIEEQNPNLFKRGAYMDESRTIPRYPHALPLEALAKKQKFMTADQFSCHYLLDPVSKESQKFKKEWFGIISSKDFDSIRTFLMADPAGDPTSKSPEKKDSDYTGIVAVGVNSMFDVLIRDMFFERVNPTEATEALLSFILRYNPYVIGIERAGMGNMAHYVKEELRKRGRFALIEELLPAGRSKYSRIIQLEPLARRHKIYMAQECNYKDEFYDQITKITNGIKAKHDDLIDPLAYLLDLLKVYGVGAVDTDKASFIPPELRNLDQVSRDYWMSVRKAKEERNEKGWTSEFERNF